MSGKFVSIKFETLEKDEILFFIMFRHSKACFLGKLKKKGEGVTGKGNEPTALLWLVGGCGCGI